MGTRRSGQSHSLDGIFRPRSVAVIGASRREGAIGRQVVANIVGSGFTGPVYPVNRRADTVMSILAYRSVTEIPGPVDLAVIVVPADDAVRVAEECGKKGVKGLVVVTAGFNEIGGEGTVREARLRDIARAHGMRVIGPNCMGVINSEPAFRLNASFAAHWPGVGRVAMVSQSGALGESILADAASSGLGVAMFASVGNRVDVTAADLIEYWEHCNHVALILLYIESFGDPQKFVEVARRVSRKKPIIAVKSGRSAAGAAAAGSHTGSVAGADIAADTMLAQCGVLRVPSFREMFAAAAALLHQPLPKGDRVAVVTNAGGPGILATDALVGLGLQMATLGSATEAALRRKLPGEASLRNPVDLIASADADRYRAALRPIVKDGGVDALIVMFVSPVMIDSVAVAQAIVDEVSGGDKPVLACVMGRSRGDEALALLKHHGIPVFRFPEDAARTLSLMVRHRQLIARRPGNLPRFRIKKSAADRLLRDREGWLPAEDAEAVLAAYGIPFAASRRVASPGDAVTAAHELGFPVVLKGEAEGLLHKSDLGAVVADLKTGDEVFAAAGDMQRRLKRFKGLRLQVQRQARGHREVLLGMTRDPRYGPLFALGLGGTLVEVLRDVAVRVAPLDHKHPGEMLASLKGAALLGPFRGEPGVRVDVVEDALLRLQQLVLDFPAIQEVEVNPFILAARGIASVAVDARLRLGSGA